MPLGRQEINGFLGVNLRKDRASLEDQELARAINADLHSQVGTAVVRLPKSKLYGVTESVVRRLARINGVRYAVAGQSVFREQALVGESGMLSENFVTTLTPFRPLNDSTTWAFMADDATMRKFSETDAANWGIEAPDTAPTILAKAGGSLNGDYTAVYTYIRFDGTHVAHESNPSPTPTAVTLATPNQQLLIQLNASTDPQVNGFGIYRSFEDGTTQLLDSRLSIDSGSLTLVSPGVYQYTSSMADSALGTEVELDNDTPPLASWCTEFQGHMVLARDAENPHYLWFSKRFRPESVPVDNFLEIGSPDDPIQSVVPLSGLLAVLTRRTKYRVVGNTTTGFVPQEALSARGTPAPNAALKSERGLVFVARDGVFVTNVIAEDQELSAPIAPLFFNETVNDYAPINWSAANSIAAAYWKGRYYLSLPTGSSLTPDLMAVFSSNTARWYFFDHPARSLLAEDDTDLLLGGFTDGVVYVLEDASGTPSSTSIDWQKDGFLGSLSIRKLFQWAKVDIDAGSESVTVQLYVDGVLKRSTTVTGTRRKVLITFPDRCMGYVWRVRVSYTGRSRPKWYGCEVLGVPYEAA